MWWIIFVPFWVHGVLLFWDELYFHRIRRLPRIERITHPLVAQMFLFCIAYTLYIPFSIEALSGYAFLSVLSSLLTTIDESVHAQECTAWEHWVHSLLFLNHPLTLISNGIVWYLLSPKFDSIKIRTYIGSLDAVEISYKIMIGVCLAYFIFIIVYWNMIYHEEVKK